MAALVKNGDLVPDNNLQVTKEQARDALMRIGIHEIIATETTEANFQSASCRNCPAQINLFEMNTIRKSRGDTRSPDEQPQEHFRSTGIRDSEEPSQFLWQHAESRCLEAGNRIWTLENNLCLANIWDSDTFAPPRRCAGTNCATAGRVPSNDVNEDKRPDGCGPSDSGEALCPSQLHGAINFMFQAFGDLAWGAPPWQAQISQDDYKQLWLEGEYPAQFSNRSPRGCMLTDVLDLNLGNHFGCKQCLEAAAARDSSVIKVERYCRCIESKALNQAQLSELEDYQLVCLFERGVSNEELLRERLRSVASEWAAIDKLCSPTCVPFGSFTIGTGLPQPPAVPPGAPSLPPAPAPDGFVVHFSIVITLTSSAAVESFDERARSNLATSFADSAGVKASAVTVEIRAGSSVIEVTIDAGPDAERADAMQANATASVMEEFFASGTVAGIPVTTTPEVVQETILEQRESDPTAIILITLFGGLFGSGLLMCARWRCVKRREFRKSSRSKKPNDVHHESTFTIDSHGTSHPDSIAEPPAAQDLPTDALALPAIQEANSEEVVLCISPQQALAVEPQQALAVEPQQATAVEPQQATAVEPQQALTVQPQQATAVQPPRRWEAQSTPPVVERFEPRESVIDLLSSRLFEQPAATLDGEDRQSPRDAGSWWDLVRSDVQGEYMPLTVSAQAVLPTAEEDTEGGGRSQDLSA